MVAWVCKGCGYVTPIAPRGACPFCKGPASNMVEVEVVKANACPDAGARAAGFLLTSLLRRA